MLVKELVSNLSSGVEHDYVDTLGKVRYEGGALVVDGYDIAMDEVGIDKLSRYLGVNKQYMLKCPPELRESNINFWLNHFGGAEARFFTRDGKLSNVYGVDTTVVPARRVAEVIQNIFTGSEDEINSLHFDGEVLEFDATSKEMFVEVPSDGSERRPVGDVTFGGIRAFAYSSANRAPRIQTYMNRLVCSNGLTITEPDTEIRLKGNTVEEVLADLEVKARQVLDQVPARLEQYADTANHRVSGDRDQFIYQVGRERGLSQRVMDRVMVHASDIPSVPTVYDVLNIFTEVANESVTRNSRLKLQGLGGRFVSETADILHRCSSCERPL